MGHQIKKNLGVTLLKSGVRFRVWAPFAAHVDVITPFLGVFDGSNIHSMTPEPGGYWTVLVRGAEAGQNYKFRIDTGKEQIMKNDPRGRALTASENGVSVVVGADFDWQDDAFTPPPVNQQIIYELHVGTFNRRDPASQGTFDDAIEKLDYLKKLGINMIEVMPITSMAFSNGWGYNVSDLFSIENSYGGRRGFMEFVKAAHTHGIGIIVDVVYNHFMSADLWRYDGWYENDRGGIYFYNDERGDTPWGSRPDYGRPEVRQFLLDNIVMWINEFHVDGLRLDSTIFMRNTLGHNDDPAHDIGDTWSLLQEITTLAHKMRPSNLMIAEDTAANEFITKSKNNGGCGFDAQWELGFPHALREALGAESVNPSLAGLRGILEHRYNGNYFERIIFSDSHDTASNGSARLNDLVAPHDPTSLIARQKSLLASAVVLTSPGIPMLLQGVEFMQPGTFTDWQVLDWQHTDKYQGIVLAHQHLIALRLNQYHNTAGLLGQSTAVIHQDDVNHVVAYHRWDNGGAGDDVVVIVNFSEQIFESYDLYMPRSGEWLVRFNSSWKGYSPDFHERVFANTMTDESRKITVALAAYSVVILSQDK